VEQSRRSATRPAFGYRWTEIPGRCDRLDYRNTIKTEPFDQTQLFGSLRARGLMLVWGLRHLTFPAGIPVGLALAHLRKLPATPLPHRCSAPLRLQRLAEIDGQVVDVQRYCRIQGGTMVRGRSSTEARTEYTRKYLTRRRRCATNAIHCNGSRIEGRRTRSTKKG